MGTSYHHSCDLGAWAGHVDAPLVTRSARGNGNNEHVVRCSRFGDTHGQTKEDDKLQLSPVHKALDLHHLSENPRKPPRRKGGPRERRHRAFPQTAHPSRWTHETQVVWRPGGPRNI